MKKALALLLAGVLILMLSACGVSHNVQESENSEETAHIELTVYAAASLTEALTEIGNLYMQDNPDISLVFTYDSSGTLKTQIEEGSYCDIFISAAQKQMDALDAADTTGTNTTNADYILSDTRIDLLENKVTLCISDGNDCSIDSYESLIDALEAGEVLLSVGNADVPVGQYTQKIFSYFNIDERAISDSLTYGSNAKEVTTAVAEGTADCGIIYATDAYSAGLTPIAYAEPEMCGQVIYPAAVLKESIHTDAAQAFLDYLSGAQAAAVFEAVGFTVQ